MFIFRRRSPVSFLPDCCLSFAVGGEAAAHELEPDRQIAGAHDAGYDCFIDRRSGAAFPGNGPSALTLLLICKLFI